MEVENDLKIGIIGCGHVGYSHLIWLAKKGFSVKGLDVDEKVKEKIYREFGPKSVASSISDMIDCNSIHICVPTEQNSNGSADLTIIENVVMSISRVFQNTSAISIQSGAYSISQ